MEDDKKGDKKKAMISSGFFMFRAPQASLRHNGLSARDICHVRKLSSVTESYQLISNARNSV